MENNISVRIQDLEQLDITVDVPEAYSGPISVNYVCINDSNFEDYGPFCYGLNRLFYEAMLIKDVNDIMQEGIDVHVSMLYTWRSISRPFYSINVTEGDKYEFLQSQFNILIQPMKKLYALSEFIDKALKKLVEIVDTCVQQGVLKIPISEGVLTSIGRLISMLGVIDDLRSIKDSIRNDFCLFKGLIDLVKHEKESGFIRKVTQLTLFRAEPLEVTNRLKETLSADPRRYEIIYQVLELHANILENHLFFDPHRSFEIVHILLGCLTILDNQKNLANMLVRHKIPLARLDKILCQTPAISLVGDMIFKVSDMLKRTNIIFNFTLLDQLYMLKIDLEFNFVEKIPEFHVQYLGIMSELLMSFNSYTIRQSCFGLLDINTVDAQNVFESTAKALRLIGNWSYTLHQLFFCKMSHPFSRSVFYRDDENVDDYSLATRYNYSPVEKSSISRIIFLIKSMFNLLKARENLIISAINVHTYRVFQNFIRATVHRMHQKLKKSKSSVFKTMIENIINISSDNVEIVENKRSKRSGKNYNLNERSVGPLSTQLYLTRSMLSIILNMKEAKKFIEGTFTSQIRAFLNESAMFHEMLNFSKCLDECTRLDVLWFKDYFIELSAGKHVQYPIDDSIPWIMISHLLKNLEPNSSEFTLYLMGIYDDAAEYILNKLKVRHLYDEVVSEAQLAFKQLCYHLGRLIYSKRRTEVFDRLISKSIKNTINKRLTAMNTTYPTEGNIGYQVYQHLSNLCEQRSVKFLGGRINLNTMLSQRMHHSLKESLRNCITYFENQDIHSVVLLSSLIDIYRQTHVNLSKDFELPPFEDIFREVNNNMPGCLPLITRQIIRYLVDDLAHNYSFSMITERFIRSPQIYSTKPISQPKSVSMMFIYPSKGIGNLFQDFNSIYSQFVGLEHFVDIFKLVGYSGFVAIVNEIKKCISNLLTTSLGNHLRVLQKVMPLKLSLPPVAHGITRILEFLKTSFEKLICYQQMRSGVFHNLRILGNYFLIVYMLEKAAHSQEADDLYFSTSMGGVFVADSGQNRQNQTITPTFDFIQPYVYDIFSKSSIPEKLKFMLKKANDFHQEKANCGLSLFATLFDFMDKQIVSFCKDIGPQNLAISDNGGEFYRIMNAIYYYMSLSLHEPDLSIEYIFGDGLLFGGIFLTVSLSQEDLAERSDICLHSISASKIAQPISVSKLSKSTSFKNTLRRTMRIQIPVSQENEVIEANARVVESMKRIVSKRQTILRLIMDKLSRPSKPREKSVMLFHPPSFVPPRK